MRGWGGGEVVVVRPTLASESESSISGDGFTCVSFDSRRMGVVRQLTTDSS